MKLYHVTFLSNIIKGFDKYKLTFDKDLLKQSNKELKYSQLFLLKESDIQLGINKYENLLTKYGKDNDSLIILESIIDDNNIISNDVTGTGFGYYNKKSPSSMKISRMLDLDFNELIIEEVVSDSYLLNYNSDDFISYDEIMPRSISFLPIAIGCNASCPFCFSKNSISLVAKQKLIDTELLKPYFEKAKDLGIKRAVITGGGEPSLVKEEKLLNYIQFMKQYVDKVVMISNGQVYTKDSDEKTIEKLKKLEANGLDVLSISRHGYSNSHNTNLMYLDTNTEQILRVQDELDSLKIRLICVLQKLGVEDETSLIKYLDFASQNNVKEICFKELYVSTSKESVFFDLDWNKYSYQNQIPLELVISYLERNNAVKVGELNWGSPIYKLNHKGKEIQIACYTEPSVFWEQTNKLARSWNILSNGDCYGSLEVKDSLINLDTFKL